MLAKVASCTSNSATIISYLERMQYKAYICSSRWKRRRLRYFRKHGKLCAACRTDQNVTLHHMSYDRLGNECIDRDLVALCRTCHDLLHRLYPHTSPETTFLFLADYQRPAEPFLCLSAEPVSLRT